MITQTTVRLNDVPLPALVWIPDPTIEQILKLAMSGDIGHLKDTLRRHPDLDHVGIELIAYDDAIAIVEQAIEEVMA